MGKATIIAPREDGLYLVRREYDWDYYAALVEKMEKAIEAHDERIEALEEDLEAKETALQQAVEATNAAEAALAAGGENPSALQSAFDAAMKAEAKAGAAMQAVVQSIDAEKAARLGKDKRLQQIKSAGEKPAEALAWCADYTEAASGEVPTIEIPGEPAAYAVPVESAGDPESVTLLIRPREEEYPNYDAKRDGLLMPRAWQTGPQVFFNAAILPGWQKFKPGYRAAVITAIDEDNDTCSVSLAAAPSSAQGLDTNQTTALDAVPISYMTCNAAAFEVGDQVVVEFPERKWASPKVIGFLHHPKPCLAGRFVWMPEGFHLFPRSAAAPTGWGLPIVNGEPTAGGPLPFVLVNRKEHNNYPDKLAGRSHRPVGLNYMPADDAMENPAGRLGVKIGREIEVDPQFGLRWQQEIYEPDAGRWYAHWAEPMQLSPIQQGMLDATNAFRAAEGVPPLYPALRGVYGGVADMMLAQIQKHRAQVHEYPGFDPGYVLLNERVEHRAANFRITRSREVLASMARVPGEPAYQTGKRMVESVWNETIAPLHYAALVADEYHGEYGDLAYVGFAHSAAGRGITQYYEATYQGGDVVELTPPLDGVQGVQVFYGTDRLLSVHRAYWRGTAGTVSWYAPSSCKYGYIHLDFELVGDGWEAWCGRRSTVAIKGRTRPVYTQAEGPYVRAVIGAALRFDEDELRLVVCAMRQDKVLEVWEGPAWEKWDAFSVQATFDPTAAADGAEGAMLVGYPVFSASGARCVVPITRRVFHTGPALRQTQVNFAAADGTAMVVGSVIDFMEWSGASFSRDHRSSLSVTPNTISTSAGRNEYNETCLGSYRWLADYDGDTLVYATVDVDGEVDQWAEYTWSGGDFIVSDRPEITASGNTVRVKKTIQYPDGSSLVTTDVEINEWRATGFELVLHTLDILNPSRVAYSRQELGNVAPDNDRPSVALSLHWHGETIRQRDESVAGASGPEMPPAIWRDGCAWGGGVSRMSAWSVTTAGALTYFAYAHPAGLAYATPATTYPATAIYPSQRWGDRVKNAYPADIGTFQGVQRGEVHAAAVIAPAVAPRLMLRRYDSDIQEVGLNMWEYGGEWLLSGYYVTPIWQFREYGFLEPEAARMLWRATFDLAAAVGKPIGNNIEPVGVV